MNVKQGRMVKSEGIHLSYTINLRTLLIINTYKYLGMSQATGINEVDMKQSLQECLFCHLKQNIETSFIRRQ